MTHTEIKKALYKQNPSADFMGASKGKMSYLTLLPPNEEKIWFEIPFKDLGDAKFYPSMDSKLLIRWLVVYGTEENN
jgi:hypothetical protein